MSDPCLGSPAAWHPEVRLKLALQTTEALAEYARAEHLTEADELPAGFLALLLAHGSTSQRTG